MNEKEIRQLKKKFIRAAMIAIVTVVTIVVSAIYGFSLASLRKEAEGILDKILQEGGTLTEPSNSSASYDESGFFEEWSPTSSAEFPYRTRYFSVLVNEEGETQKVSVEHIVSVNAGEAEEMVTRILTSNANGSFGRIENYYYKSAETDEGILFVFMDGSEQIAFNKRILFIGLSTGFAVIILVYLLLQIIAERMIQPEVENVERQKEFITNASHDLKTPLAVIRANTEIDIAINGENEWKQSILRQTDQMTELIGQLITSAKMDEEQPIQIEEVPISSIAQEEYESFQSLAKKRKINLESNIQKDLKLQGSSYEIRQLLSLLLDNAVKYCDQDGTVRLLLNSKGKRVDLLIANTYQNGAQLNLNRLFERFYRNDQSRSQNDQSEGHGIGLSVAQKTAEKYKGKIQVSWKNNIISFHVILNYRKN